MFGSRNSAYAFWHTVDIHTYIHIYHPKSRLNSPVWGSLCSPNYIIEILTCKTEDSCQMAQETDEERKARLKKMVATTQLKLALETEEERRARLEHLSDNPIYIPT